MQLSVEIRRFFASSNVRQMTAAAVLLALAVIGLTISHKDDRPTENAKSAQASETLPDTIIDNAQLDAFDSHGQKIRQLIGKRITYFDGDQHSLIDKPQLKIRQQKDEKAAPVDWEATAERAIVYQSNNTVDLFGNAVLLSPNTPNGPTKISSEYLHINTERRFAQTDKAVTIQARNSEAHAVGMWADIKGEHLSLPSRVKEIHEVQRKTR
jgi:LPS export ABC transporter protein LptC